MGRVKRSVVKYLYFSRAYIRAYITKSMKRKNRAGGGRYGGEEAWGRGAGQSPVADEISFL
jgi:hypothetical protein